MRLLGKIVAAIVILYVVATGAYYVQRKKAAERENKRYELSRAPLDLIREFTGGNPSEPEPPAPEAEPSPSSEEPEEAPDQEPVPEAPPRRGPEAILARAREHYQEGQFDAALADLQSLSGHRDARVSDLADRARLFAYLVEDTPDAGSIDPGPMALIRLRSGDPFLVRVVDESDDQITFRKPGGIGARVKKKDLKEIRVARSPEQKKAVAEDLYQRRHADLRDAGDHLSLARFCRAYGLGDHITYLLEKGLDQTGDGMEKALFEIYAAASRAGATNRATTARFLLERFFRSGEFTARAHEKKPSAHEKKPSLPSPSLPAVAAVDPDEVDEAGAPASGIGGVGNKARRAPVANSDVNALLAEADTKRRKADEHYEQSFPGSPDRAKHRKIALAAYTEAYRLYELLQDEWGVKLERTIKEVQIRRYQLLKDTPAR